MVALPMETEGNLSLINILMSCFGSGLVTSSLEQDHCFVVHGTQYVAGGWVNDDFVVSCRTDMNSKWGESGSKQQLPKPRSFIGFTGTVMHFREYAIPGSQRKVLCIVVNLQTIKFLKERVDVHPAPAAQDNTDIHVKLLSTMQKRKEERTAASLSSGSPKVIGKQVAGDSEEEVVKAVVK